MDCRAIRQLLWAGEVDRPAVATHLDGCDRCAVESLQVKGLLTALSDLGAEVAIPPVALEPALLAIASARPAGPIAEVVTMPEPRPTLEFPRAAVDRARGVVAHPRFWKGAAVGAAAATVAAFGLIVARRIVRPDLVG